MVGFSSSPLRSLDESKFILSLIYKRKLKEKYISKIKKAFSKVKKQTTPSLGYIEIKFYFSESAI